MDIVTLLLAKEYADQLIRGKGAIAGKSAYEIAQENGYTGSVTEWLQSLKGEPGPAGSSSAAIEHKKGDYDIEKITVLDDNGEPIRDKNGEYINIIDYISNIVANPENTKILKGHAKEDVANMTYGWNLGNTFDATLTLKASDPKALTRIDTDEECPYYETLWGAHRPTEQIFDLLKESGFNIVRIPITWSHHVYDDEDFTISKKWLERIKEVVKWVVDRDMYCIINTHHDSNNYNEQIGQNQLLLTHWLHCEPSEIEVINKRFIKLWKNIAEEFKDFGDKLIFEPFNEVQSKARNWKQPTLEEYRAFNILQQSFIDTVRDSGGNNSTRTLSCQTYAGFIADQKYLEPPVDTIKNGIIWQVHDYSRYFNQELDLSNYKYFTERNMPVIVGEFGTKPAHLPFEIRLMHLQNFIARTKAMGIKCIWWDDDGGYEIMNRANATWYDNKYVESFQEGYKGKAIETTYLSEQEINNAEDYSYKIISEDSASQGTLIDYDNGAITNTEAIPVTGKYVYVNLPKANGYRLKCVALYDDNDKCLSVVSTSLTDTTMMVVEIGKATKVRYSIYNPWGKVEKNKFDDSLKDKKDLSITVKTF